jgi:cell wall-associated NlpC family hydrolase
MTEKEQLERQAIITESLSWLGTPYHACARIKGAGVDCGLFIAEVFERCGIVEHIDPGHYVAEFALHHSDEIYKQWVERYATKITDADHSNYLPLPGDILLYKFGQCRSHGAIVLDYPKIIHAYINRGVTIDTAEASYLIDKECDVYSVWKQREQQEQDAKPAKSIKQAKRGRK